MTNRKRLFKILTAISLALVMLCGAGIFSACSMFTSDSNTDSSSSSGGSSGSNADTGEDEKATVTSVVLSGFNLIYRPDDAIDFDSMTITVYYDDGNTSVLKNILFNETGVTTDSNVEAVVTTSGLYGEVGKIETLGGGEIPEGTYPLNCVLTENGKTYGLGTVEITKEVSKTLDVVFFEDPEFLNTYKTNVARTGDMDDDNYFAEGVGLEDYCVGNDNAFKFAPRLTVENKNTGDVFEMNGYDADVAVTLIETETETETVLPLEKNDYVAYSDFEFDFTEEAIGKQFRIEVSPADFDEDEFGQPISPIGMVVNVESGYNVYDALDLGRMNLVDSSADYSGCTDTTSRRAFWDENNHTYKTYRTYDLWEDFLEEKGEDPATLKATKGIYLHTNIDITSDDIPSEFFVSESEARQVGAHYTNMIGSIRDTVFPYTRYMTSDFTLNGNLFRIDCSTIKYCLTLYNNAYAENGQYGYLTYYADGATVPTTNSCLFCFSGLSDTGETSKVSGSSRATAYFKNVDLRGNVSNPDYGVNAKSYGIASGSLQAVKSMTNRLEMDNCIIREFSVGLHSEFSKDDYVCIKADGTKLLDIYNSGLYSWVSAKNQLNGCVVRRIGGPAVMAASKTTGENNPYGYYFDSGCDVNASTVIENYVAGDEGWFVDMDITWIRSIIDALDESFKEAGKTLYSDNLNENGSTTLNLEFVGADNGMGMSSGDTSEYLNLNFSLGDTKFVLNESEAINTKVYSGPSYKSGDVTWIDLGYGSLEEYEAALINTYEGLSALGYGAKLIYKTNTGKIFAPNLADVLGGMLNGMGYGDLGSIISAFVPNYGTDPLYDIESLVFGESEYTSYSELDDDDTEVFMYLYINMGSAPMMYVIGASLYDYVTPEGVSATLVQ